MTDPNGGLTASDTAFLREWIDGRPPLMIEPDCEERLRAAGLIERVSTHLQLTQSGRRYFDRLCSPRIVADR